MPRCRYHLSREMVPSYDPETKHAGTETHLHGSRIALKCPVPGCWNVDVAYNAKPPDEGTRMWNAVGLKGHRDLDWLEVE